MRLSMAVVIRSGAMVALLISQGSCSKPYATRRCAKLQ